jgi:translation initiation factor 1
MSKEKIATDGGQNLGQNPFGALGGLALPSRPVSAAAPVLAQVAVGSGTPKASEPKPAKNRGRVEVLRMTAGRGGKTVTVARAFVGIGLPEKEQLAKKMQKTCGCGGTVKDGQIEVQGDKRDEVARILTEAGFRPVMAGG